MHEVPEPLRPLVSELAVVPLPASTEEAVQKYCRDILSRLFELQITRVKADKMGQLQRLDPAADPEDFQRLNRELMMLEMERRALRSERSPGTVDRPGPAVPDFVSTRGLC